MSKCAVHSLNACFVRLCAVKRKCCAEYSVSECNTVLRKCSEVSECNTVLRKCSEWFVSRHVVNVLLPWCNEKTFMKKR
jgi:hypothetical protein